MDTKQGEIMKSEDSCNWYLIMKSEDPCNWYRVMFNILSYLPLKYLVRFKLVDRRLWNALLLNPDFMDLHVQNYKLFLEETNQELGQGGDEDCFLDISNTGYLTLRRSLMAPLRYTITQPFLRQHIEIPNPQHPSLCIALDLVPAKANQVVKLLSVHENKINQSLGYEILNVGFDTCTYCWRAVEVDDLQNNNTNNIIRKSIQVFFGSGVAYCILFVENIMDDVDIEVDILDMHDNGSYIGHTTFPRGFFPKLKSTHLLDWNGQLSFAEIVKDELHVLVLEDHKKQRWSKSKIIKQLPFHVNFTDKVVCAHKSSFFFGGLDNKLDINESVICAHPSTLVFVMENNLENNRSLCSYDMVTGTLTTLVPDLVPDYGRQPDAYCKKNGEDANGISIYRDLGEMKSSIQILEQDMESIVNDINFSFKIKNVSSCFKFWFACAWNKVADLLSITTK